jgi:hypothetical protein
MLGDSIEEIVSHKIIQDEKGLKKMRGGNRKARAKTRRGTLRRRSRRSRR